MKRALVPIVSVILVLLLSSLLNFGPNASTVKAYLQTKPTLDISCRSSTSCSCFNAEIKGNLAFNGTGMPNAPVLLSYSVNGGEYWLDLTLVNTGSDGNFSATWIPYVTGNYLVKATYEGDENYLGTAIVVNMAVTQFAERNVFSVTSNSTVSSLVFNSTSKELSFTLTGPSGTSGYADVYVAKTLIQNASSIQVFLDGNKIDCAVKSIDDSRLFHFIYNHSSHHITINLGSSDVLNGYFGNWIIYGVVIAITVISITVLTLRRKRSSQNRK